MLEKLTGLPSDKLRNLPPMQRLLDNTHAAALLTAASRQALAAALRIVLDEVRLELRQGTLASVPDDAALVARAGALLTEQSRPILRRVINATGIMLHTNLGRAPLAAAAVAAIAEASRYCNLEFDLASGRRGARLHPVEAMLCRLTGAEAALVVNNNAAAMLLALAPAAGGEVIVSRGELVEIGGGFRIPEVITQGGARLVEVGTTNKTRIDDFRNAVTPATSVLLKVHQSNYRIIGFTGSAATAELAGLAREKGLRLIVDLGSGTLADLRPLGRPHEPTVAEMVGAGADIVAFSGDKLLGGPQCGILVGTEAAIAVLRRHPLLRALRIDKLSLAALEATLRLHLDPASRHEIPVIRMLGQTEAVLTARAETLCGMLPVGLRPEIVASTGYAGGGTLPDTAIPSRAVALAGNVEHLALALRSGTPAVVGRLTGDRLLLDMLAVTDTEVAEIAAAIGTMP